MNILIRTNCHQSKSVIEQALSMLDADLYFATSDEHILSILDNSKIEGIILGFGETNAVMCERYKLIHKHPVGRVLPVICYVDSKNKSSALTLDLEIAGIVIKQTSILNSSAFNAQGFTIEIERLKAMQGTCA